MKRVLMPVLIAAGVGLAVTPLAWRSVKVGDVTPTGVIVASGRTVQPMGTTVTFDGAVVDAAMLPGNRVVVKHRKGISMIRLEDGRVLAHAQLRSGASLTGIATSPDGKTLAASDAQEEIHLFDVGTDSLTERPGISLPKAAAGGVAYPCGLTFVDPTHLAVAANRDNSLNLIDLRSQTVERRIPVGVAPYQLVVRDSTAYVTCWASAPADGAETADSSGTRVQVDRRGIGVGGEVDEVDLATGRVTRRFSVLSQPTEMALDGGQLFVACSNGDEVVQIDLATGGQKPMRLKVGKAASPNSLSVDSAGRKLWVAYGGLDRVGAWGLDNGRFLGFRRTGWYPSVVRAAGKGILVGTAKGVGSRSGASARHSVYDLTGTLSWDENPKLLRDLPPMAMTLPSKAQITPIPKRSGEPSPIKHVVYVIKENRTYDQLVGDLKGADGDPSLVLYGEEVTPNHHALAREFVLLDNYYCNGINSADGHAWTTEGNATTYFERSHGGWTRSYPFGDDPLATSSSGYLWDNALDHGLTVVNFGEFDYAKPDPPRSWSALYQAFLQGEQPRFKQNIGVARLRKVSDPSYPGWNLGIPDVLRADRFIRRLHGWDRKGTMPDLTLLYLPQDHTSGGAGGAPTPRAHIADNDLALGRCIEAISRSQFWRSTAIFVIEDDPQDGFDHVDGHRSLCLVVSPYARRRAVVSQFYNQTSVLRTMEHILGLPPMNRNDASAPLMSDCFTSRPNFAPYIARPNRVPLDEMIPPGNETAMRMDRPDQVDSRVLNRTLWRLAAKREPFPARFEGAHGTGLAARKLSATQDDADDD